jgi:hypothetical protein
MTAVGLVQPAEATSVVPISEEALAEDAAVIVIGYVTAIQAHHDRNGDRIRTHITISVADVLKGEASVREITLRQPGGSVGDVHSWLAGSPRFAVGEKVLLFLREDRGRALRVAHLYQGKFTVVADAISGEEYAVRETPADVHAVGTPRQMKAPLTSADSVHRLRDLTDRVRGHLRRSPGRQIQQAVPLILAPQVPADAALGSISSEFSFMGPARWFEPDSRTPVVMKINSSGEPLAPTSGFDQVRQAFRAWSAVPGAAFRYQDGGFTTVAGWKSDGVNAVTFRDPDGEMDPPVDCRGTLAIGGFYYTAETVSVNGTVFSRIMDGDVVFNDGWEGCNFYENFANLAEVATHELGHVLGLGHSLASDATMYAYAHFDQRGAALKPDDKSGLRAIYPNPHRIGVYRGGAWYLDADGSGVWGGCSVDECVAFGGDPTDVPLFGDWTGNGASKVGVFRSSEGTFYLDYNGNGVWDGCSTDRCFPIGLNGDVPLVGDWNASGTAKVGTFRPSDGTFYLDYNGNGQWDGCGTDRCLPIGLNGDVPLVGDWNATGASKVGVFRPCEGRFYFDYNGSGTWDGCGTDMCAPFGGDPADVPVVGSW